MLLAAGREVVSKTSAYNITKLSYRVEVRVSSSPTLNMDCRVPIIHSYRRCCDIDDFLVDAL